ncbi:hypothetical protein [Cupriavidus malaysiensis]|uniref:hypothetical protein n=1 Tax=Cupriavidus malaysiensis TaxID=367825 RepID=UPI00196B7474|nr:hypothetical protein [Cupriavidus malaysiensis]
MDASTLIDALGGTNAVARLLNIKAPSVTAWREKGIPDDKLIRLAPYAERVGVATRKELRPNDWHLIWPELAEASRGLPTSGTPPRKPGKPRAAAHEAHSEAA